MSTVNVPFEGVKLRDHNQYQHKKCWLNTGESDRVLTRKMQRIANLVRQGWRIEYCSDMIGMAKFISLYKKREKKA